MREGSSSTSSIPVRVMMTTRRDRMSRRSVSAMVLNACRRTRLYSDTTMVSPGMRCLASRAAAPECAPATTWSKKARRYAVTYAARCGGSMSPAASSSRSRNVNWAKETISPRYWTWSSRVLSSISSAAACGCASG